MQSKMSSINKELLVYIFRSAGWVSLLYVMGLLFALPLEVLMSVMEERTQYYENVQNLFFIHSTIQYALILVIPILLAVFLFRFLQVKQSSDFIHSLPLSRKQIYVHHLVAGIVFLLLPLLLTALILLVFQWTMDISQLYTLKDIGPWIGITFSIELFIFAASIFIGMITGLSALQAVLTYVLLLLPVGLVILFVMNIKYLLFGFSENYYLSSNIWRLSPVTAASNLSKVKLFSVDIIVYFILAVCLLFVSFLLYKKRKHEYVSHAFVFRVLKPVFKYGMTTGVMLLSGYYFSEATDRFGWLLFGYVMGAIIGYLLAEMVLQKTWRIKLQLKGFGYYVVVMLVCMCFIKLDLIGFEKKVPDTADIKKVYLSKSVYSYYDDKDADAYTFLKEERNIKTLRKLHEQIIEHGKSKRLDPNKEYPSIFIKYELENGRKITREYYLRNYDAFSSYLKKIYESQEYKERAYSLIKLSPKDVYRVQVSANGNLDKTIQLSEPQEIKKATEALQADLANQTFEEMTKSVGEYGYISFTMEKHRNVQFSWLASFQHFNEWMEQTGKAEQARIQADDLSYIIVQKYDPHMDYYYQDFMPQKNSLKIDNADQMGSLLDTASTGVKGKYVVALYYKQGNTVEIRGLSDEHAPNFIKEHLGKR